MERQNLKQICQTLGLAKADLHIHPGKTKPQKFLHYVENKTDLDVIAITEHDTIEPALKIKELHQKGKFRFEIITGEEITTADGHLVGLFLEKTVPAGLSAKETIRLIKKQGGLAMAVHPLASSVLQSPTDPAMCGIGLGSLILLKNDLDIVEVFNANMRQKQNNYLTGVSNKTCLNKAGFGSSDAHFLSFIGRGYTLFPAPQKRAAGSVIDDLLRAIENRQTAIGEKEWTFLLFIRYGLYFFLPISRLLLYTLLHGRRKNKKEN
ncbi:MAG: hypothetical protein M1127_00905 [Patescibacteria group bacterium]|nr:hypothetical protein [Patescibacteria group bacterium]